jgi:hypothetical protein
MAPFSSVRKRVQVPPDGYLDATLAALVVADSVDKLLTNPRAFYDTAILYPDRTQLRSTEPFLGFALLALPLQSVARLGEARVFELLRWLMLFASLVYAYLLFRAAGVEVGLSAAGAAVALAQPNLLIGISRLQLLSIPLILAVLYHAVMVWGGREPRAGHSLALFGWMALYPLCGIINATVAVVGAVLLLPLIVKMGLELSRERRLASLISPAVAAVATDAIVLAPWLFDRADMRVYTSPDFLAVKRWAPTFVPLRASQVPSFLDTPVGASLAATLLVASALTVTGRAVWPWWRGPDSRPRDGVGRTHIWVVPGLAVAMAVAASYGFNRQEHRWLGWIFDAGCAAGMIAFWRAQLRVATPARPIDVAQLLSLVSAGLGVLLCLLSFGPVTDSNRHPLASVLTNVMLLVVPPLKAIREFDRLWIFGILFLSLYAVVRIGDLLRSRSPLMRTAVVVILLATVFATVNSRPLVASPAIEAPMDFVAAGARSTRTGAIYVHPYMKWNARSGVLMIAIARELKRPVVNGYLGVVPPWVTYATNVLWRYPDAEALWLLRKWKVETVFSVLSDPNSVRLEQLTSPIRPDEIEITELPAGDLPHPSAPPAAAIARERVETTWTQADRDIPTRLALKAPERFAIHRVEIHFSPTAVAAVPPAIDVYGIDGNQRVKLNDGLSGQWLEALAAEALVRREMPVATITLVHPVMGQLELRSTGKPPPPIERIVLVGERR